MATLYLDLACLALGVLDYASASYLDETNQ